MTQKQMQKRTEGAQDGGSKGGLRTHETGQSDTKLHLHKCSQPGKQSRRF